MAKKINRTPIALSKNAVALIQIFTRTDHLEDIWQTDIDQYFEEQWAQPIEAAKQFVEQLEEEWCVAFMVALRNEIDKILEKHPAYKEMNKKKAKKDIEDRVLGKKENKK